MTQATLSRDLKRLGIGKAPSNDGGYTYILSEGEVKPGSDATYIQDFTRGFLSIEFSGNLGLMRTLPGHASSVASALDNLRIREVLGTIAGDDTVLIVPRNGVTPFRLMRASAPHPGFAPGFPGGERMKAAVLGATGYTGHDPPSNPVGSIPQVQDIVAVSSSQAGTPVRDRGPGSSPDIEQKIPAGSS